MKPKIKSKFYLILILLIFIGIVGAQDDNIEGLESFIDNQVFWDLIGGNTEIGSTCIGAWHNGLEIPFNVNVKIWRESDGEIYTQETQSCPDVLSCRHTFLVNDEFFLAGDTVWCEMNTVNEIYNFTTAGRYIVENRPAYVDFIEILPDYYNMFSDEYVVDYNDIFPNPGFECKFVLDDEDEEHKDEIEVEVYVEDFNNNEILVQESKTVQAGTLQIVSVPDDKIIPGHRLHCFVTPRDKVDEGISRGFIRKIPDFDLYPANVALVQSIQNVPYFIKDKKTAGRIWIGMNSDLIEKAGNIFVTADLEDGRTGGTIYRELRPEYSKADKENGFDSANVYLGKPSSIGRKLLSVTVAAEGEFLESNYQNNEMEAGSYLFKEVYKDFNILYVPVNYIKWKDIWFGAPPTTADISETCDKQTEFFKGISPMPDEKVTYTCSSNVVYLPKYYKNPFWFNRGIDLLLDYQWSGMFTGAGYYDLVVGVDTSNYMSFAGGSILGKKGAVIIKKNVQEHVMIHEFLHTLWVEHPFRRIPQPGYPGYHIEYPGKELVKNPGWDVYRFNARALGAKISANHENAGNWNWNVFNIMGDALDGAAWIQPDHYRLLMKHFVVGDSDPEQFVVAGKIYEDGRVDMRPVFNVYGYPVINEGDGYSVDFLSGGNILDRQHFSLDFEFDDGEGLYGTFLVTELYNEEIDEISIKENGREIYSVQKSLNYPTVELGEVGDLGDGRYSLDVFVDDLDGNELIYSLAYAANKGRWDLIGFSEESKIWEVDVTGLPKGAGKFKVIATDGFNTVEAETELFDSGNTGPRVAITMPYDRQRLLDNEEVATHFKVIDLEDGYIENIDNLQVYLDGEEISIGGGIIRQEDLEGLSLGKHVLEIVGRDSRGLEGRGEVEFFIVDSSCSMGCDWSLDGERADVDRNGNVETFDLGLVVDEGICFDENNWCGWRDVNRDGKVDSVDRDLVSLELGARASHAECSDGRDNDGDGYIDNRDRDCVSGLKERGSSVEREDEYEYCLWEDSEGVGVLRQEGESYVYNECTEEGGVLEFMCQGTSVIGEICAGPGCKGCTVFSSSDFDKDRDVDVLDLNELRACLDEGTRGDVVQDGRVNILDQSFVKGKLFCNDMNDLNCALADVTLDSLVNVLDQSFLKEELFSSGLDLEEGLFCLGKDLDGDGLVGKGDLDMLKGNWGSY
jgi:hypothetical protein